MATALQNQKFSVLFDRFDADQNGKIDQTDIDLIVQGWCTTFEIAPGTPKWRTMVGHANKLWQDLLGHADTDGDKEVSREEWVNSMDKPEFLEDVLIPFALATYELADTDGDGRVSREEMDRAQQHSGMSPEDRAQSFAVLDIDGDGYVTKEEFTTAARDFFLSTDANAPGNLLAGKLG
ncbi:EF-hand domain-containing protein [Nocardia panacis]|uniref:EF-hand domain-containing protein n=1 Tax=Nocardia panacis TaxID=2340916 RepID=A0A3A4JPF4_9NOCA|nr:EF-hand domain-containing protein [Nocardia panacis]RJO70898.1 EF-hand domain-containing protein [Nocardia panacis]